MTSCVCVYVCVCARVCACVPHSSLSERKFVSNKSNSESIAISSNSLGAYQLTSPVIAAKGLHPKFDVNLTVQIL